MNNVGRQEKPTALPNSCFREDAKTEMTLQKAEQSERGSEQRHSCTRTTMSAKVVVLVLVLCAGWGGLAPALKVGLREVPPVALAGWRFLIGLGALLLWCGWHRVEVWAPRRHCAMLGGIAALFVVQIALLNIGTRFTSAGHSTLLLSTHPLFVALFAHFCLGNERLSLTKVLGLLLAFGGVAVVVGERLQGGRLSGDLLVLASAILLGALITLTKWAYRRGLTPYQVLVGQMLPGVVGFFVLSWALEGPIALPLSRASWASILYQGLVVAGFGFAAWNQLLEHYAASWLSAFQFTVPIFGVVFSAWVLAEPFTGGVVLGTLLVGAGLAIANRTRPAEAEEECLSIST